MQKCFQMSHCAIFKSIENHLKGDFEVSKIDSMQTLTSTWRRFPIDSRVAQWLFESVFAKGEYFFSRLRTISTFKGTLIDVIYIDSLSAYTFWDRFWFDAGRGYLFSHRVHFFNGTRGERLSSLWTSLHKKPNGILHERQKSERDMRTVDKLRRQVMCTCHLIFIDLPNLANQCPHDWNDLYDHLKNDLKRPDKKNTFQFPPMLSTVSYSQVTLNRQTNTATVLYSRDKSTPSSAAINQRVQIR